jgi:hypothetical protein
VANKSDRAADALRLAQIGLAGVGNARFTNRNGKGER